MQGRQLAVASRGASHNASHQAQRHATGRAWSPHSTGASARLCAKATAATFDAVRRLYRTDYQDTVLRMKAPLQTGNAACLGTATTTT